MFSTIGIRTVKGEGSIHMTMSEKRKKLKQQQLDEELAKNPHYSTEADGMVSLILPGLREAILNVEKKMI